MSAPTAGRRPRRPIRFGFYSTMHWLPWGGSEELWSQAALELLARGHAVSVSYRWWPTPPAGVARIAAAGGSVSLRAAPRGWLRRGTDRIRARVHRPSPPAERWVESARPDYVVIAMAGHLDPPDVALACLDRGIPYAINPQVASSYTWVSGVSLETYRRVYGGAHRCLVVSAENLDILTTQLAMRLPRVTVVDNPVKVRADVKVPYPGVEAGWRLAVVGRLHAASKGQDLVIKVLGRDRWRGRPLRAVLWGEDHGHERLLRDLVGVHGVEDRVEFGGYCHDVEAMWASHHALLLPSRYEGLPGATVEAMLCGRVPIVTRCGRNGDLVDDGETGFLAASPTVDAVEDALERAWSRRAEWEEMGQEAARRVRERYSAHPGEDLATLLEELAGSTT